MQTQLFFDFPRSSILHCATQALVTALCTRSPTALRMRVLFGSGTADGVGSEMCFVVRIAQVRLPTIGYPCAQLRLLNGQVLLSAEAIPTQGNRPLHFGPSLRIAHTIKTCAERIGFQIMLQYLALWLRFQHVLRFPQPH